MFKLPEKNLVDRRSLKCDISRYANQYILSASRVDVEFLIDLPKQVSVRWRKNSFSK